MDSTPSIPPDRTPPSAKGKKGTRLRLQCVVCNRPFLLLKKFRGRVVTCSDECSSYRRQKPRSFICEECGSIFERLGGQLNGSNRFCSNPCRMAALQRIPRHRCDGEIGLTPTGYRRLRVWEGDEERIILEHRLVMERHIGRRLRPEERVHHINGDKLDNDIENLRLYATHADHLRAEHPNNPALASAARRRRR